VVRVLESDDFVLLLERLDHTRILDDAPLEEAVRVCTEFLRTLAIPAPPSIRTLSSVAKRWITELPAQSEGVVPERVVAAAVAACERFGPIARPLLTNEDLHYENVLGRGDSWVMIDPKPIAGDPEFSVLPLLWNRFGEDDVITRYETIVREAGLDPERARAWTLARAVDNWIYDELSPACRAVGLALAG
jgi:streptomycin 6-kinase